MRKIFIAAVIICCWIIHPADAFEYQSFGIKGGYVVSTITGTMSTSPYGRTQDPVQTYSAGIYTVFKLRGYLFLQPELLYSGRGFVEYRSGWCIGGPPYWQHQYEYIDLPVLLKLSYFSDSDPISPTVIAGPCVSYFNNYHMQSNAGPYLDYSGEAPYTVKRWELSGIFGIGLDYKEMVMDIRYQHAFTKHMKYRDVKNEVWSLSLGVNL